MPKSINTYVFFDTETTGLPHLEENQTKIIELCFLAASQEDISITSYGRLPHIKKFKLLLNPKRPIDKIITNITGISNELLKYAPYFEQTVIKLIKFLNGLPKPICLVAHNGDKFDYPIFIAECRDAGITLPEDILCVDSLIGFRKILKGTSLSYKDLPITPDTLDQLMTSDSDEDENISSELNLSSDQINTDKSCLNQSLNGRNLVKNPINDINNIQNNDKKINRKRVSTARFNTESFTLKACHVRLLNKNAINAHRAEADCLMLLDCVVSIKEMFLPWAQKSCKPLIKIKSLR